MPIPRVSTAALMAALVVIALDCVVFRSLWSRPFDGDDLTLIVLATLPMANLLAVGAARLARGRISARPFLAGFEVGGGSALVATLFVLEPGLDRLVSALRTSGTWFRVASALPEAVLDYEVVAVLPLLFQVLIGLAAGGIARSIAGRRAPAEAAGPGSGRLPARSYLVLLALAAIPAVAVEGIFRFQVDPATLRLAVGTEAVIEADDPAWMAILAPLGYGLDGARVEVESDREVDLLEVVRAADAPEVVRHVRPVRVKVLAGFLAGESIEVPRHMIRPPTGREVAARPAAGGAR